MRYAHDGSGAGLGSLIRRAGTSVLGAVGILAGASGIQAQQTDTIPEALLCERRGMEVTVQNAGECGEERVRMDFPRGPTIAMYDMHAITEDGQRVDLGEIGIGQMNPDDRLSNRDRWRARLLDPQTHDQRGVPTVLYTQGPQQERRPVSVVAYEITARQHGEDLRADPGVPLERVGERVWRIPAQDLLYSLEARDGRQGTHDVTLQLSRTVECEEGCLDTSSIYADLLIDREEVHERTVTVTQRAPPDTVRMAPDTVTVPRYVQTITETEGFTWFGAGPSIKDLHWMVASPYENAEGEVVRLPQDVDTHFLGARAFLTHDSEDWYLSMNGSVAMGEQCDCPRDLNEFDGRILAQLRDVLGPIGIAATAEGQAHESENSELDDSRLLYAGAGPAIREGSWTVGAFGGLGEASTPWVENRGPTFGGVIEMARPGAHLYLQAARIMGDSYDPTMVSAGGEFRLWNNDGVGIDIFAAGRRFLAQDGSVATSIGPMDLQSTGNHVQAGISISGLLQDTHSYDIIRDNRGEVKQ